MVKYDGYDTLEFNGGFLIPGFSIYLLEISKGEEKFFYIGMTGDPFYPSARSGFHRLAGHLEKAERSTQNQLWIGLKNEVGVNDVSDFRSLKIKMHHFPVPGFIKWSGQNMHHKSIKANSQSKEYKDYKKLQEKVLELENALIYKFQKTLLNKTAYKKSEYNFEKYQAIFEGIESIIKIKKNK